MTKRVIQKLKLAVYGTLAAVTITGSATVLHHHDWDISSTGIVRFGRAVVACAEVVIDYKRSFRNVAPGTEEYAEVLSQVHQRSAERLRAMCCVNRGSYIKVGQHIGALDYLLPVEYVHTFRVLHSDAPQSPISELETVFKEETGKKFKDVFSCFEVKPCGTASLAQVHRATYHDGTTAAVKIQHPKVKAHSFVDMKTMEFLIMLVSKIFPNFQFAWLADEMNRNLPLELDFCHEAHNCERVAKMFQDFKFLKVPEIHWDLTTERVLTMEYCEGGQINDKAYFTEHDINVNQVSQMVSRLYSEMIFVKGYVHCDPHPGNVLVHKSPAFGTQIVLLDHGLYTTLTERFRMDYSRLWSSLIAADEAGIRHYSENLGIGKLYQLFACMVTARTWDSITNGIDKVAVTKEEDGQIKENVKRYLSEISDILNSVPREMLLIMKTNDLLRGIEENLKTRADARALLTMSRACVRAVHEYDGARCATWMGRMELEVVMHIKLLKISLYAFYLWFTSTSIAKYFKWTKSVAADIYS